MRKTKLIIFLIVMCLCQIGYSFASCAYYKTGKFILFEQKAGIHTRVERTATEQIETDLKTGKYIKFKVRWTSDCEYELLFLEGNSEQCIFFRNRKLTIKITDVYADGYKFEGKLDGSSNIISNILRVL